MTTRRFRLLRRFPLQSAAAHRGGAASCSFSCAGPVAHQPSNLVRPRLSIRALRPGDMGAALADRRLLHQLRQPSRRHSGLPAGRAAAHSESSRRARAGPLSRPRRPRGPIERRAQHMGTAPPTDPYSALVAAAVSCVPDACWGPAAMWWVTRRLYGNLGGYTALGLYCFSPAVLRACVAPNPEVLAALGVYGGVYTCIGVQPTPCRGLRTQMEIRASCCSSSSFGIAAASHIAALPVAALLRPGGHAVAGRGPPVPGIAGGASSRRRGRSWVVFACYGFSPGCLQLCFPLRCGIPLVLARPSRGASSSSPGQRGHHHCRRGSGAGCSIWGLRRFAPATSAIRLRCSAPWSSSRSSPPEYPAVPGCGRSRSCSRL